MIPNEVLTEELLQQATKQYAEGIIASLPYLPPKNAIISFRMRLKKRCNLSSEV